MMAKYMNTSNSHCYYEGKQGEILLDVCTPFCRFLKGAFCRKSHISTGRNDRLKTGKLLNPHPLLNFSASVGNITLWFP